MKRVSAGRRTVAALLELLALYGVNFAAMVMVAATVPWSPVARPIATATLVMLAAAAFGVLYGTTEIFGDGTPTKRLLGLRVRSTAGTRITPAALAGRWAVKTVPFTAFFAIGAAVAFGAASGRFWLLVLLVLAAGLFLLIAVADFARALSPSRQAVHDRIVGAVVTPLAATAPPPPR